MPRISENRQLENEIASTNEVVTLAMLLDSDSESEEAKEDDFLRTLALAFHAISDARYHNRGTRGLAGRLLIEEAITEYLSYHDRSFLVDFRMHLETIWAVVDLLHE